jgi:raffinose/stachyose/melibiose transport system substrate-binding protein
MNGNVYTAALNGENTMGILYNKGYFDEKGLTEPQSYDEFIALCEKIKNLGDMSPLVVGAGDIWHLGFLFNQCWDDQVMSADPDFIKHCYEGSKNFTDPTVKAAITELGEIMQYAQKGWASTPDSQITTFLVNDMAAMLFSGTHMFPKIPSADPDFKLGWFPIFAQDGKLRLVGGSGISGLAISTECEADTAKFAAAVDFLEFFFDPEIYGAYCSDMSVIPAIKDSSYFKGLPLLMEVVEATAKADTLTPFWNAKSGTDELPPDFRNFTYKTVIEVLQGQRSLDSACNELNKAWAIGAKGFNPVTGTGF